MRGYADGRRLRRNYVALGFLAAAGFPVPRLRPAADGRPFARVAGRQATLFVYAAGEELTRAGAGPERCRRVGEQLGRLHELASAFPGERANPYGPARVRGWIEALREGCADPEVLAALPLLEQRCLRGLGEGGLDKSRAIFFSQILLIEL